MTLPFKSTIKLYYIELFLNLTFSVEDIVVDEHIFENAILILVIFLERDYFCGLVMSDGKLTLLLKIHIEI